MEPSLTLLILLLVAAAAGYAAILLLLHRTYGATLPFDETHLVPTGGGWQMALHRLRPAHGSTPREIPVILGHGTAMSSRCWDATEDMSLARHLRARGHDVWIAEYRGSGDSCHDGSPHAWAFSLEQYAREDVHHLVEKVCELTGSATVRWVGHSLGGIIVYRYAAIHGTDRLDRVVTIASPSRIGRARSPLIRVAILTFRFLVPGWRFPLNAIARVGLPFTVYLRSLFLFFFCNPRLQRADEVATLFTRGVMDMPNDLLKEYGQWLSTARMELASTGERLEEAPAAIDVPLLVLGGAGDALIPPRAFSHAYEVAPTQHKKLRVFGGEGDPAPPMGHLDLVSSRLAVEWVFPEVVEWLEEEFEG
jgi:pimeloyl-ACP methyl ester carboxylesterase